MFTSALSALVKALVPESLLPVLASKAEDEIAKATTRRVHKALLAALSTRGPVYGPEDFDGLVSRLLTADAAAATAAVADDDAASAASTSVRAHCTCVAWGHGTGLVAGTACGFSVDVC